ncbi:PTR2-domain-containing protein [Sporormia fimetaria CBS 119925]|uniref:PTR2-domain-containing protein n=1 Tax=Sporormia fimetaria CBS 119925 TaxID=1340428 RepID=A0A6A6UZ85_9PLEO|nr:PTR2-domain-containing protein [Sporormia fimetaria CBS 119925]
MKDKISSQEPIPHNNSTTTLVCPSPADVKHLRRVPDDIPARLWAVAVIGFWERFTFWGLTAPWQNYIENAREHKSGAPGALGLGQAMATRIYCGFYLLYYITPIAFAILSDTRLGRYKTLVLTSILYLVGCGIIVASSADRALDAGLGLPGLIVAMVLVGLGGGGFKMIMVPFIADQYVETAPRVKTLKSGERVFTDQTLTLQYIYNLYYWVGNVGSLSWFATTALEKYHSFAVAYGITFGSMVIATGMLVGGARWYIQLPHEGNVLPKATKVLVCAARNNFKMTHAYPAYQLSHHGKYVLWTTTFVDELSRGLRACRVLIAFIVFYICFDQMQNNLISQAKQMVTHSIPNDMMPALNQVFCILLGPIVQYGLYPFLNRHNIPFKPIARITVGFIFIALSMLYAAITQHIIYTRGPCFSTPGACDAIPHDSTTFQPNDISVWLQTPVYFLIAIGEIFAYVTALEYSYDHSPKSMKAIVQAISLMIAGLGSAAAMGLTPVARDPWLVALYGGLFGGMAVTTGVFWWCFRRYDGEDVREEAERKREGVEMGEGLRKEFKDGEGEKSDGEEEVEYVMPANIWGIVDV